MLLPLLAGSGRLAGRQLWRSRSPRRNPTAQATLLGQYGDWGAYTASPGGQKVCFALAKPTSSVDNPPNRRTAANAVYMFISTRPAEKVSNEVSVLVTGYVFKAEHRSHRRRRRRELRRCTPRTTAPGSRTRPKRRKLIDTMRKGADVVIKATTSRGTQTTDTFSLKGIAQALDRVAQECK